LFEIVVAIVEIQSNIRLPTGKGLYVRQIRGKIYPLEIGKCDPIFRERAGSLDTSIRAQKTIKKLCKNSNLLRYEIESTIFNVMTYRQGIGIGCF
jgi:hypothetical protein